MYIVKIKVLILKIGGLFECQVGIVTKEQCKYSLVPSRPWRVLT